jgi:hypothetical protein
VRKIKSCSRDVIIIITTKTQTGVREEDEETEHATTVDRPRTLNKVDSFPNMQNQVFIKQVYESSSFLFFFLCEYNNNNNNKTTTPTYTPAPNRTMSSVRDFCKLLVRIKMSVCTRRERFKKTFVSSSQVQDAKM